MKGKLMNSLILSRSNSFTNQLKKFALLRFHPRSIIINTAVFCWFIYYLWIQDIESAVSIAIFGRIVSLLAVMYANPDQIAKTTLGKIGLLHLNPYNLFTQIIGFVVLFFGVWEHHAEIILAGISLILVGHIYGWEKVTHQWADKVIDR